MSKRSLSLYLAFLIPILFTLATPYSVIDLAVWIAHGDYFLKAGSLLRHDIFSVLPTSELIYPSYSVSVLYALLYRAAGLIGVCSFHALVVLPLLLFILYRPLIRDGWLPAPDRLPKLLLFLFWLGAVPTFNERPAMVALLPLALSFQIILSVEKSVSWKNALYLSLLEILWANLHGSFILLPLMLGWRLFFQFPKLSQPFREWGILLLILASSLLNPFGAKIYPYLLATARASKLRGITEWGFPNPLVHFPTAFLFWGIFGYALFFLVRQVRQKRLSAVLSNPYFLILLLGTLSIRNAAMAFVLLLPAAHSLLSRKDLALKKAPDLKTENKWIQLGVAGFLTLAIPLVMTFKPKRWDESVAFQIADHIRADGRSCAIFNDWDLGSFFMLELPNPIYLDTRNVIYSDQEFQAYQEALRGDATYAQFLKQGNACFIVVKSKTAQGLMDRLKDDSAWKKITTDGEYTLYALTMETKSSQ